MWEYTLLIFFDSNLFDIENPSEILVSNTCYKYFYDNFNNNENINKNKTILDLINYQFDFIVKIIKKSVNIRNIIFIIECVKVYK